MERMDASASLQSPGQKLLTAARLFVLRIGWGVVSIVAAVLIVGVVSPARALEAMGATVHDTLFLSPYLAGAFALGGYLKAANVDVLITRVFRGRPIGMIFAATAFASFTPFCSCSVIALIAVLLEAGTPLFAVMAFWVASPVVSPDLFLYTAGLLGIDLAVARVASALFMGLSAGFATLLLEKMGAFRSPMRKSRFEHPLEAGVALSPTWRIWKEPARMSVFFKEFKAGAAKILPWMVLAFFLENLMTLVVPTAWIASAVGDSSAWAIPLAALVSLPTYANPIAAVPVVKGLVALGMTKSAALAYITAGSVTTIPALMGVLPLVRMPVFLWHVFIGLATALIAAYTYQFYLGAL